MASPVASTSANASVVPPEYLCPISLEIMTDPVVATDGHTYERSAIMKWFDSCVQSGEQKSPMTGARMPDTSLTPNFNIKKLIADFLESGGHGRGAVAGATVGESGPHIIPVEGGAENLRVAEKLTVGAYKDGSGVVRVEVLPPDICAAESQAQVPTHLVLVVDVSYSMTETAEITDQSGSTERHGFTILDLVKHALLTTLCSLNENYLVSIITFSDIARTVIKARRMDAAGRTDASAKVKALRPESRTNLWLGLQAGLEALRTSQSNTGTRSEILLFTDGVPNVEPPRGHLTTLRRYLEKNPEMSCAIRTFGFGFNLDSELLESLSFAGPSPGTFSFIPDPSMLGTIFIHSIADILSGCPIVGAKVSVESVSEGGSINITETDSLATFGQSCSKSATGGFVFNLGTIAYGQMRTFVLPTVVGGEHELVASISYRGVVARSGSMNNSTAVLPDGDVSVESLAQQYRLQYCRSIAEAVKHGEKGELDIANGSIQSLIETFRVDAAKHPLIEALLKDLEGEVALALSTSDFFNRWGKHYLRSLYAAHLHQKRNNFKDPGVQQYGGEVFESHVDAVSDIFDSLPPPEPTASSYTGGSIGYPSAPSGQSSCYVPRPAVQSMSVYNSVGNVCFGEGSTVQMGDGTVKLVQEVRKGDVLQVVGGATAFVRCVVKTACLDGHTELVQLKGGAMMTPWHPVHLAGMWSFPCEVAPVRVVPCSAVYNFLLESGHRILVNGVETVTLGHCLLGEKVEHAYFGTEAVVTDLERMQGFDKGLILLPPHCLLRDAGTGRVVGLTQCPTARLHAGGKTCSADSSMPLAQHKMALRAQAAVV